MPRETLNSPKVNQGEQRPSLGLKPTFGFLYDFLGKVFSTQTKCKDFEMEKHETEALAQQSDDLVVEFFPHVQSKWIKLIVFVGSLMGIYGKKYLAYLEQVKKDSPIPAEGSKVSSDDQLNNQPQVVSLGSSLPVNPNKRF